MNPEDIPVDDVDALGPCPDCTHDLVNHEGDGYSRGPCLVPGCFCDHEDVTIPALQWAAVTGLPEKWIAEQAEYPTAEVHAAAAVRLCARELRKVIGGEA